MKEPTPPASGAPEMGSPSVGHTPPEGAVEAAMGSPPPGEAQMGAPPPGGAHPTGQAQPEIPPIQWGKVIRYGWKLLSACPWMAVGYCALYLLNECASLAAAQLVGTVTQQVALSGAGQDVSGSLALSYWLWVAVGLVVLVIALPITAVSEKMNAAMTLRLRGKIFSNTLKQSPEFFHHSDSGEITAVINHMSQEAQLTLRQVIMEPILQFSVLLITTALLIYNFIKIQAGQAFSLLGFEIPPAVVPIAILILAMVSPYLVSLMSKRIRGASGDVRDRSLELASLVTGTMQSPEEIQAMNAEEFFGKKHQEVLNRYTRSRVKQSVTMEFVNILNGLPVWLVPAILLGLAVAMASDSSSAGTVGNVVAVFMLAPQLISPIQNLSGYMVMTGTAWPGILQVLGLIERKPKTGDKEGAVEIDTIEPTLESRGVTFAYRPELPPVFSDLSFHAKPRSITGLVARMGQGKTTFFRLALRFYAPQSGEIYLGGHGTGELTRHCLRKHVALMSQFPAFFHDTLRENLRLAKPDADDDELQRVCESTGMWGILTEKLGPSPLDADFSAGRVLSGGQCKLLALTRCLLRDPTFVFLDEPTTGMDNSEKYALIPSLRAACQGKTVIAVDHDIPWMLKFCDSFLVLDGGGISEQGSADELLASGGILSQLHSHTQRQSVSGNENPPQTGPGY